MEKEFALKEGRLLVGKSGLYLKAETDSGHVVEFRLIQKPNLVTFGVRSFTADFKHVLLMDFDSIQLDFLKKHLDYLAGKFNLSHFIVIRTAFGEQENYHAVCLEKFSHNEILRILSDSMCDYNYKRHHFKTDRGWVLRLSPKVTEAGTVEKPKPEFVKLLAYSSKPKRKISRPHLELFGRFYPEVYLAAKNMELFSKSNLDDENTVKVLTYGTSSRNFLEANSFQDLLQSTSLRIVVESFEVYK